MEIAMFAIFGALLMGAVILVMVDIGSEVYSPGKIRSAAAANRFDACLLGGLAVALVTLAVGFIVTHI